jgi:negative regulator of genetic competence, sporulation and motility
MELIVIGESRLKIMLTGEDMARYELTEPDPTGQNANSITPHTREVLRHIFADAHSEIGFDTEGERLFVQLYASKGGGCEIFVTKLGEAGEDTLLRALTDRGDRPCGGAVRALWLRLETLEDVTALCRRLGAAGFAGESRLYIGGAKEDSWYLSLTVRESPWEEAPYPFLWEYGEEVVGNPELYLSEYGTRICGDFAVERMRRL